MFEKNNNSKKVEDLPKITKITIWGVVIFLTGFAGLVTVGYNKVYPFLLEETVFKAKSFSKDSDNFGGLLEKIDEKDSEEVRNEKQKNRDNAVQFLPYLNGTELEVFTFKQSNFNTEFKGVRPSIFYLPGSSGVEGSIVKKLFEKGFDVITYSYPDFGNSSGKADYNSIVSSAEFILNYILTKENKKPEQIGVYSMSLGTVPALYLTQKYAFSNVLLINPIDNLASRCWENTYRLPYKGLECFAPQLYYQFNNTDLAKKSLPTNNFTIITSESDELIPAKSQQQVFNNLNTATKSILTVPGQHRRLEEKHEKIVFDYIDKIYMEKWDAAQVNN